MMTSRMKPLWIVCALTLALPVFSGDEEREASSESNDAVEEEKFELIGGLGTDYKEMAEITKMTTSQQEKLAKISDEKTAALAKWDERNGKRIATYQADAQKARTSRDRESYQRSAERLEDQRKSTAYKYDAKAVQLLKSKQRSAWFTHRLWGVVDEQLAEFTSLSPEQEDEAKEIVNRMARGFLGRRDIAEDTSCINRTISTIRRQVMDSKQRREYDKAVSDKEAEERDQKRRERDEEERNAWRGGGGNNRPVRRQVGGNNKRK